jgi:hypothetical protein
MQSRMFHVYVCVCVCVGGGSLFDFFDFRFFWAKMRPKQMITNLKPRSGVTIFLTVPITISFDHRWQGRWSQSWLVTAVTVVTVMIVVTVDNVGSGDSGQLWQWWQRLAATTTVTAVTTDHYPHSHCCRCETAHYHHETSWPLTLSPRRCHHRSRETTGDSGDRCDSGEWWQRWKWRRLSHSGDRLSHSGVKWYRARGAWRGDRDAWWWQCYSGNKWWQWSSVSKFSLHCRQCFSKVSNSKLKSYSKTEFEFDFRADIRTLRVQRSPQKRNYTTSKH